MYLCSFDIPSLGDSVGVGTTREDDSLRESSTRKGHGRQNVQETVFKEFVRELPVAGVQSEAPAGGPIGETA